MQDLVAALEPKRCVKLLQGAALASSSPIMKPRIMAMPPPSWWDVNILAMQPRLFAMYVTLLSCPVFFACSPASSMLKTCGSLSLCVGCPT